MIYGAIPQLLSKTVDIDAGQTKLMRFPLTVFGSKSTPFFY
jgi:hypothetical protein